MTVWAKLPIVERHIAPKFCKMHVALVIGNSEHRGYRRYLGARGQILMIEVPDADLGVRAVKRHAKR